MDFIKRLYGTKTFKFLAGIILSSLGAYAGGTITGREAVAAIVFAVYGMLQRDATLKSGPNGGV